MLFNSFNIIYLYLILLLLLFLLLFLLFLYNKKVKLENQIFQKFYQKTNWNKIKEANLLGDNIGDNFLNEIKLKDLYETKDLFKLAKLSGQAGMIFYKQYQTIPIWINLELVKKGAEFQQRWIEVYLSSSIGSIIESYGYSNGANILIETGRLTCGTDTKRRLLETAIFNYNVIEYGLHDLNSPAFETIARVRLLHCLVRRHVKQSCPWWDFNTMGTPVSQEDGAHTIYLNSHVTLRGMENQGLPISLEEKNAVSMFWSYVGYLLGIDEKFLPKSYEEEILLYETIFDHSFHPSEHTNTLVKSTISSTANLSPYYLTEEQQILLIRLSLGEKLSNQLNVPTLPKNLKNSLFIFIVRGVTFFKWFLYNYFNFKILEVKYLRKCINDSLELYGKGQPKWRFVVTRKVKKSD